MRKEYTINELASLLGCSRTAVVKKIKPDENNPDIKRYKGRYEVGNTNGQITILMDDKDLEHEQKLSKGANTGVNNTGDTVETSDVIDIEPEKNINNNETVINLTERYTNQLMTLQKEMYNELRERDNQILLLTTSEKTKEDEYLRTKAENQTLKLRNRVLTVITGVVATLCIIWITVFITATTLQNNVTDSDAKKTPQEIQTIIIPADKDLKLPNKKH